MDSGSVFMDSGSVFTDSGECIHGLRSVFTHAVARNPGTRRKDYTKIRISLNSLNLSRISVAFSNSGFFAASFISAHAAALRGTLKYVARKSAPHTRSPTAPPTRPSDVTRPVA